jgi:hypothetical protein
MINNIFLIKKLKIKINRLKDLFLMLYSSYYLQKNTEPDNDFIKWVNTVENKVLECFGLHLLDIPDEDYMGYYSDSYNPNEMVQIIQESNGFVKINQQAQPKKKQRKQ